MSVLAIRTVGQADIGEEITFVTKVKLSVGERIALKVQIPVTAPVYGTGQIVEYKGPGRDQAHRKYVAERIS